MLRTSTIAPVWTTVTLIVSGAAQAQPPAARASPPPISSAEIRTMAEDATRAAVAGAPHQAGVFNNALVAGAPDEDTTRPDFWRLLGLLVSPEALAEEGGNIKLSAALSSRVNLAATLAEPVLSDAAKSIVPEEEQAGALAGLDPLDNATYEVNLRLGHSRRSATQATLLLMDVINQRLEEAAARDLDESALIAQMRLSDVEYRRLEDAISTAPNEMKAARALELDRYVFKHTLQRTIFTERDRGDFVRLQRAYQNRLQVHATGRYRDTDPLVGQAEASIGATAQWGWPQMPRRLLSENGRAGLASWLSENGDGLDNPHLFSVEASWKEKRATTSVLYPSLNAAVARELRVAGTWQTKLFTEIFEVKDTPVGADQAFTVTWIHPTTGDTRDRFVVKESLVFHLTDELSVPLSVSYANRSEFLDEREIRGNVGVSFSFQRKNEGGE